MVSTHVGACVHVRACEYIAGRAPEPVSVTDHPYVQTLPSVSRSDQEEFQAAGQHTKGY